MQIWAHRGASTCAPENTLEAFQYAISLGVQGMELDVHLCADGIPVVIHDADVARLSNGRGRVKDLTLAQLKELDFSKGNSRYAGAQIPALEEALDLMKPSGVFMNIEIKTNAVYYPGIEETIIKLAKKMQLQQRILYSSFNHYTLQRILRLDSRARIGVLYGNALTSPEYYAEYLGAYAIHPPYAQVLRCPALVENCHRRGIRVHAWTANAPGSMVKLCQLGVDALVTDRPDLAISLLQKEQWHAG